MTQKKNVFLGQMKELQSHLNEGIVSAEDICNHAMDTAIDTTEGIVANEIQDLLGLSLAIAEIALVSTDEEATIDDVISVVDLVLSSYIQRRRAALQEFANTRDVSTALLESAIMQLNGEKFN